MLKKNTMNFNFLQQIGLARTASNSNMLVKLWWAVQTAAALLWLVTAIIIVMRVSDANELKTPLGEHLIPQKGMRTTVAGLTVAECLLWVLGGLALALWAAMEVRAVCTCACGSAVLLCTHLPAVWVPHAAWSA